MTLRLADASLSRRPALVVTNAIELNNIPDPPVKHLERPVDGSQPRSPAQTNSPLPRPPPFRQKVSTK